MAKHSIKEIQEALDYAIENGWTVRKAKGKSAHSWGFMLCPTNSKECRCGEFCRTSIWSTPKSPANHAKAIRRVVDNCKFKGDDDDE